MELSIERMETQLVLWSLDINRLEAKVQRARGGAGFDALMSIDELKAFHAIAKGKLIEFKAAGSPRPESLTIEIRKAWSDLETAFMSLSDPM